MYWTNYSLNISHDYKKSEHSHTVKEAEVREASQELLVCDFRRPSPEASPS